MMKSNQAAQNPRSSQNWKIWVSIAAVAILIIVGNLDDDKTSTSRKANDLRTDACVMSHVYMSNTLKAPATAKYPACSTTTVSDLGGGKWQVRSYVDSQNGFGALIRTQYTMELQHISGENWQYLNVVTTP